MTYGQLKLRLTQMFPSVSLDIVEGFANDRYQEILGELAWTRLDIDAVLQTAAPYVTGTVSVTLGSSAIALTGGAWIAGMTGRQFRATGQNPAYTFTYLSATTGTLDRPYEGPTAALSGYSISQSFYPLPPACRILRNDAFGSQYGEMQRFTHEQLNSSDPLRTATGTPCAWASYMDDNTVPPNMQVELYPTPNVAMGIPFTYGSAGADLASTTAILQVWNQPAAMIEGCSAKLKMHLRDYPGAQLHMVSAKAAMEIMKSAEAQGMAPMEMKLDPYFTRYRRNRGYR